MDWALYHDKPIGMALAAFILLAALAYLAGGRE